MSNTLTQDFVYRDGMIWQKGYEGRARKMPSHYGTPFLFISLWYECSYADVLNYAEWARKMKVWWEESPPLPHLPYNDMDMHLSRHVRGLICELINLPVEDRHGPGVPA
jgi:hypothetical protein